MEGYIWVDAICIDQANVVERKQQVLIMDEIFARATRTVGWLGRISKELASIIWLCNVYLPVFQQESIHSKSQPIFMNKIDHGIQWWPDALAQQTDFYTKRRWFSRCWVLQEYMLSNSFVFRCGPYTLDPIKMFNAEKISAKCGAAVFCDFHNLYHIKGMRWGIQSDQQTDLELAAVHGCNSTVEKWYATMLHLACWARHLQATDKRDKIYSILGIGQRSLPRDMVFPYIVDYESTVKETYFEFTNCTVRNLPLLTFLSYAGIEPNRKLDSLPSWCPDYTAQGLSFPFIHTTMPDPDNPDAVKQVYQAVSSLSREPYQFIIDQRALFAQGKKIANLTAHCTVELNSSRINGLNSDVIFKFCSKLDPIYQRTGQPRLEACWRTVIGDVHHSQGDLPTQHTAPPDAAKGFAAYAAMFSAEDMNQEYVLSEVYMAMLEHRHRTEQISPTVALHSDPETAAISRDFSGISDGYSGAIPNEERLEVTNDLIRLMNKLKMTLHRKLILTDTGLIGLVPSCAAENDQVWLLKGAAVPFVLRPTEQSSYLVVGEAYIHGIMDGSLVEESPDGREGFHRIRIV